MPSTALQTLSGSIDPGPITDVLFGTDLGAVIFAASFLTVFSLMVLLPETRYGTPKVKKVLIAITIPLALLFLLNIAFVLMSRL